MRLFIYGECLKQEENQYNEKDGDFMFNNIIKSLIDGLKKDTSLNNIEFINTFTNSIVPNPITSVIVAIGFGGSKINNGALGDFLGYNVSGEYFGKQTEFEMSFIIYVPKTAGAAKCCESFSDITNSLLFNQNELAVSSIECDEPKYNKVIGAYELKCKAVFDLYLSKVNRESNISSIVVKGVYE